MPTSQPRTLTPVHTIVQILRPQSVIDVGVGHGKSGVLLREYLDIMAGRFARPEWTARIFGVEVFEKYRNPLWEYAYDRVVVNDAIQGLAKLPEVDLALALDVWEHFDRDYAERALDACLKKAAVLIISTPKIPSVQDDVFGNEHERHVSRWVPTDFEHIPHRVVTCTQEDWIFVLSRTRELPDEVKAMGRPSHLLREGWRLARSLWRGR
jgi:hypothetical protein